MAGDVGLVAVFAIVIFISGVLCGVIILVAARIRAEDEATMRRKNRDLVLREEPVGPGAQGVRLLVGVGQRIGPDPDDR